MASRSGGSNLNNTSVADARRAASMSTAPPFFTEFLPETTRGADADDYSVERMEFIAGNDAVKFDSTAPSSLPIPSQPRPISYFSNPSMGFTSPTDPFNSSFPLSPGIFAALNFSPENTSTYHQGFKYDDNITYSFQTQATHSATIHPTAHSRSTTAHQEPSMDASIKVEFPSTTGSFHASGSGSCKQAAPVRQPRRSDDGYCWRKYGQKQVKESENMRSYYRCTCPTCPMRKKVETSTLDGQVMEIVYKGDHNHPKPAYPPRKNSSFSNNPASLPDHSLPPANPSVISFAHDDSSCGMSNLSDGRRGEEGMMAAASGSQTVREPKVVVQTMSNVDVLPDGYRWRKYGQKVVKGNQNPRSYYKCTSTSCPVRKHIERSSHDLRTVITTYEGKHNHDVPAARGSRINESPPQVNSGGGGGGGSSSTARPSAPPANRSSTQMTFNHSTLLEERQTAYTRQDSNSLMLTMMQNKESSTGFFRFENPQNSHMNVQQKQ